MMGREPAVIRRQARPAVVGLPLDEIGAHSYRIGGATDHANGGRDPTILKARDRWNSNIAFIHVRNNIASQFQSQAGSARRLGEDAGSMLQIVRVVTAGAEIRHPRPPRRAILQGAGRNLSTLGREPWWLVLV